VCVCVFIFYELILTERDIKRKEKNMHEGSGGEIDVINGIEINYIFSSSAYKSNRKHTYKHIYIILYLYK